MDLNQSRAVSVEECVRSRCAGGGGGGNERDVDFVKTLQTGVVQTGGALIIKKKIIRSRGLPQSIKQTYTETRRA